MNSLLEAKHRQSILKFTELLCPLQPCVFFHACSDQEAIQTLSFEICGEGH